MLQNGGERDEVDPVGAGADAAPIGAAAEGPDDDSLERSILGSLRRILRAVALYSRELQRLRSLTATQLAALQQLARRGPMSAGDLARAVAVSQATITGVLDRLERPGLIVRTRHSDDRRRVVVELTDAGRRAVLGSTDPLHERFMTRLAVLPVRQQQEIDRALRKIVAMMEAHHVEAAPVPAAEASLAVGPEPMVGGMEETAGSLRPR